MKRQMIGLKKINNCTTVFGSSGLVHCEPTVLIDKCKYPCQISWIAKFASFKALPNLAKEPIHHFLLQFCIEMVDDDINIVILNYPINLYLIVYSRGHHLFE